MLAGIPLALVEYFADVRPVLQNGVNHASREFRLRGPEHQPFGVEAFDQAIERHVLKSVEVEDAFDVRRRLRVDFDDAPPILADVAVAIGTTSHEPAFLHATG